VEAFRKDPVAEEAYYTDMVLLVAYYMDWEEGEECHKMVCRTRLMEEGEFRQMVMRQWLDQFGANFQGQAVVNWLVWLRYRVLGYHRAGIEQHPGVDWRHTKCNS
jgi:hypothetical protein